MKITSDQTALKNRTLQLDIQENQSFQSKLFANPKNRLFEIQRGSALPNQRRASNKKSRHERYSHSYQENNGNGLIQKSTDKNMYQKPLDQLNYNPQLVPIKIQLFKHQKQDTANIKQISCNIKSSFENYSQSIGADIKNQRSQQRNEKQDSGQIIQASSTGINNKLDKSVPMSPHYKVDKSITARLDSQNQSFELNKPKNRMNVKQDLNQNISPNQDKSKIKITQESEPQFAEKFFKQVIQSELKQNTSKYIQSPDHNLRKFLTKLIEQKVKVNMTQLRQGNRLFSENRIVYDNQNPKINLMQSVYQRNSINYSQKIQSEHKGILSSNQYRQRQNMNKHHDYHSNQEPYYALKPKLISLERKYPAIMEIHLANSPPISKNNETRLTYENISGIYSANVTPRMSQDYSGTSELIGHSKLLSSRKVSQNHQKIRYFEAQNQSRLNYSTNRKDKLLSNMIYDQMKRKKAQQRDDQIDSNHDKVEFEDQFYPKQGIFPNKMSQVGVNNKSITVRLPRLNQRHSSLQRRESDVISVGEMILTNYDLFPKVINNGNSDQDQQNISNFQNEIISNSMLEQQ